MEPGSLAIVQSKVEIPDNIHNDLLQDIDKVNKEFQNTDAVPVVGTNDVINAAAREKGNSLSACPS
jgi:NAD/NADP transhydrogenase beta subunit